MTQTVTYDASGRQTGVRATSASGATLTDFSYSYANPATGADTALGWRLSEPAGATTYAYDALERLTDANGPAGHYSYAYDANSNRSSQSLDGTTTTYTYNAADQMTAVGATTFSYDANGNQTGSSAGQALAYNDRDQTTSAKAPGVLLATAMTYDGSGQDERVGMSSWRSVVRPPGGTLSVHREIHLSLDKRAPPVNAHGPSSSSSPHLLA